MNNNYGSQAAGTVFQRCGFPLKKFRYITAMAAMLTPLSMLAMPSAINAQFTSGGWSYYRTVTVNPTGTTAETNFPVLVRLNGKIATAAMPATRWYLPMLQKFRLRYPIYLRQHRVSDSIPASRSSGMTMPTCMQSSGFGSPP